MDVKGNSTQRDNLLYFGVCFFFFFKSSVTSDYNETSVSVTHVQGLIFYLASLCAVATLARGCTLVRTRINGVIEMFFLLNSYKDFGSFFSLRSVEQIYLAMMIRFIPRSEQPRNSIKENSRGPTIRERALICLTHVPSGGFLLISLLALHENAKQHIWNHLKVLFYWLLTNVPTNKTQKSISGLWVTLGTLVELPPLPFMVILQNQLKKMATITKDLDIHPPSTALGSTKTLTASPGNRVGRGLAGRNHFIRAKSAPSTTRWFLSHALTSETESACGMLRPCC